MMDKVRVAIVGSKFAAGLHVHAYSKLPHVEVVAVAAIDNLKEFAGAHGIPNAYADYKEMFKRGDIDLLSVCVPNFLHKQVVCDAVAAGLKNIVCEKPLATSVADGKLMLAACNDNNSTQAPGANEAVISGTILDGTTNPASPISGASTPWTIIRRLISGTACAASGTFTVTRTISEPARASSMHCFAVEATSAVSVLAMDWTTTGAPPPTRTGPTGTPTVWWRFVLSMTPSNLAEGAGGAETRAGRGSCRLLPELSLAAGLRLDPSETLSARCGRGTSVVYDGTDLRRRSGAIKRVTISRSIDNS